VPSNCSTCTSSSGIGVCLMPRLQRRQRNGVAGVARLGPQASTRRVERARRAGARRSTRGMVGEAARDAPRAAAGSHHVAPQAPCTATSRATRLPCTATRLSKAGAYPASSTATRQAHQAGQAPARRTACLLACVAQPIRRTARSDSALRLRGSSQGTAEAHELMGSAAPAPLSCPRAPADTSAPSLARVSRAPAIRRPSRPAGDDHGPSPDPT
jgi:hypothetical protein